jgi:hypothetical protein
MLHALLPDRCARASLIRASRVEGEIITAARKEKGKSSRPHERPTDERRGRQRVGVDGDRGAARPAEPAADMHPWFMVIGSSQSQPTTPITDPCMCSSVRVRAMSFLSRDLEADTAGKGDRVAHGMACMGDPGVRGQTMC